MADKVHKDNVPSAEAIEAKAKEMYEALQMKAYATWEAIPEENLARAIWRGRAEATIMGRAVEWQRELGDAWKQEMAKAGTEIEDREVAKDPVTGDYLMQYEEHELNGVFDHLQQTGDILCDLTDKLMTARRAYEAIMFGVCTNVTVNELLSALADLSTEAEDLCREIDDASSVFPPAENGLSTEAHNAHAY